MKHCIFLFICATLFADLQFPNTVLSTPEEIATLSADESSLIGGIISPFSGQPALRITDIVARGAEPIVINRTYVAPYVNLPAPTGNDYHDFYNRMQFYSLLKGSFQGWVYMPHICIRVFGNTARYTDPSGITLEFSLADGALLIPSHGMSNSSGDQASGQFDLRNIRISKQGNLLFLFSPDGTQRQYTYLLVNGSHLYLLEKEILPNGKILRYDYTPTSVLIRSLDPLERNTYAIVRMDVEGINHTFFTNGYVDVASYIRELSYIQTEKFKKMKNDKDNSKPSNQSYKIEMPPLITSIRSPFYREETIGYNSYLQLTNFAGKGSHFFLTYGETSPSRVEKLFLPVGDNDALVDVYKMTYDSAIARQKGGKTIATRKDGSKIEYLFSKEFRLIGISFIDPNGKIKKEKVIDWDGQGRLKSVFWKDGERKLFWGRKYEDYDSFGNPKKEIFLGDLRGEGITEEYVVLKQYSQDNRNLLLREENEEGKVVLYKYIPNTNLKSEKLVLEKDKGLSREFWQYDDCLNLIEHIVDDGSSEDVESFDDVKQRTVSRYHLKKEAPFLHMPEWIEEYYWDGTGLQLDRKKQLKYDERGFVKVEEIYDADDKSIYKEIREYDEQGNLLSETNPLGYEKTSTYTAKGKPSTATDFSGRLEKQNRYDLRGRLKEAKEVDLETKTEHVTNYEYSVLDRCTHKTDYLHQSTAYDYDPISGEATLIQGPKINGQEVSVICTFDGFGRKLTETDPNGHKTQYKYNAYGSIVKVIYPDGSEETYTYYKNGNLQTHIDQSKLAIHYKYDIFNRIKEKKYAFEGKTIAEETFTFDTFHLIEQRDKEDRITQYEYDRSGRKISETFCGHQTTYEYNCIGQLKAVKESGILINEYARDPLGQILELTKKGQDMTILYRIGYGWDPEGSQTSITRYPHDKPAEESITYDPFGRITERKDALGFSTTTHYEENPILKTTATDPNGIKTVKTYDSYGRLASLEVGQSYKQTRTYDKAGNLSLIQEGSLRTAYTYDPLNRIKTLTRADGTLDARQTSYTYKPDGKLETKTLPSKTLLTFDYTPLGYLSTVDASDNSVHQTYERDLNGRLRSAIDGKHTLTRTLDDFGNVLTETVDGISYTRTYDPLNRLGSIAFQDQSSIEYSYDPLYLKSIRRLSSSGEELYTHTYESYDLSGNLLTEQLINNLGTQSYSWNDNGNQASIVSPYFNQSITYDPASRVKSISSDGSYEYNDRSELILEDLSNSQCTYAYDAHHNRTEKNGVVTSYNLLDEQTALNYDLDGNLKQNGLYKYEFDALNRLTNAKSEKISILFDFDALDRCISKTMNGTQELYLYHKTEELGSFDPNGKAKAIKIPGLHLKPIALELEGEVFVPICDHRRNIRRLIDQNAQIVQTYDYTAFGEELPSPKAHLNPWRYSGKRLDSQLGLYSFGKRFYGTTIGRWITTDPAGFIDGTNLYAYLLNDPLMHFDPNGEFAFPLFSFAWGASGLAVPAILSNPVGWAIGGAVISAVAIGWATNQLINSRQISPSTGGAINTVVGGLAGSMINSMDYSGNCTSMPQVGSAYGWMVINKKKESERHTSDQEALSDLVKGAGKKGISNADADTLLGWANEYDFPNRDDRGKGHWKAKDGADHIHLGPKHILITD